MYHFTALVTCLAIAFYFFTSIQVSKARVAFGIKVPATGGNPDFERVFRVQMNTLEWMPIFPPPSLWLFAIYISDAIAAVLGLDRRPHPLHDRLFASRRKTRPRFWHSSQRRHHSLAGRARRNHLAALSCVKIGACTHELNTNPWATLDTMSALDLTTHPRQTSRVVREVTVSDSCTAANSNSIRSPRRRAVEVAGARRDRVSWRS